MLFCKVCKIDVSPNKSIHVEHIIGNIYREYMWYDCPHCKNHISSGRATRITQNKKGGFERAKTQKKKRAPGGSFLR